MRAFAVLALAPLAVLLLAGCAQPGEDADDDEAGGAGQGIEQAFELLSAAFADGAAIPRKHACDGEQVSPPLTVLGSPDGASSLLLLVKDPDVPTPQAPVRTIRHWTVANITPSERVEFQEGAVPAGADDRGSEFGPGWRGPCPPQGSPPHRYNFTVHALDVAGVAIPDNATLAQVEQAMAGHVIGRATLVGLYERALVASSSTSSTSSTPATPSTSGPAR